MTCRAPMLAEMLAVLDARPPVETQPCDAPVAYFVVIVAPGVQLHVDVCERHERLISESGQGWVRSCRTRGADFRTGFRST